MTPAERHSLPDGAPFSPEPRGEAAAPAFEVEPPVLLLLGDGPEARALARLAAECGFAVDMAAPDDLPDAQEGGDTPAEAPAPDTPDIPGLRRYVRLAPGESAVARCGIGRRHSVCIFPPDEATAARELEDVLASHAFSVGLWATRPERERIWAHLRERGVPDAELAAVRCPLGLGDLADIGGPVASAVPVLAELLAARAGARQRLRPED